MQINFKMDKINIHEAGSKFEGLPEITKFQIRHNLDSKTMILEIEGKEPFQLICPKCQGERFLQTGSLTRCLRCDGVYLLSSSSKE